MSEEKTYPGGTFSLVEIPVEVRIIYRLDKAYSEEFAKAAVLEYISWPSRVSNIIVDVTVEDAFDQDIPPDDCWEVS